MFRYIKLNHIFPLNNYFILILLTINFSCSVPIPNKARNISFYIWQTHVSCNKNEEQYIKEMNSHSLYIKYAEFSNNEIIKTTFLTPINYSIIPVVRIDNLFLENNQLSNAQRCESIYSIIKEQQNVLSKNNIDTIQIDCDYNDLNKLSYQRLIDGLKNHYHLSVQITLNLYRTAAISQIPKADKYIIMLYDFQMHQEVQIYDEEAMNFFKNKLSKFPYPHAYALPLFNRCYIKTSTKYYYNYNLTPEQLEKNANGIFIGNNEYLIIKDCKIGEDFFQKNTKISFQESTFDHLEKYYTYINSISNKQASEIIYFTLNESVITKFPSKKILPLK